MHDFSRRCLIEFNEGRLHDDSLNSPQSKKRVIDDMLIVDEYAAFICARPEPEV